MRPERQQPPSSLDVAAAIIEQASDVDQMKLQKLLYYAQAWYLAWYDEPMFNDVIQAWTWGPAVPTIHDVYGGEGGYGRRLIEAPADGSSKSLDARRRAALAAVLEAYGDLDGPALAKLAKEERPWSEARSARDPEERSHATIRRGVMRDYYRREGAFGHRPPNEEAADALARSLGLETTDTS